MGLRQRQVKQNQATDNTNSKSHTNGKSHQPSKRQKSSNMKYYIVAVTLGILGFTCITRVNDVKTFGNNVIDSIATSLDFNTPTYVIIIDAGSTASRVNVFTFHYSIVNGQLMLDDSLFHETKPGLSSFAKTPKDVEKSLNILLDKAKSKIPKSQWASTPMFLRATAGLRLLRDNEAQNILEECKRVFASSGFKVTDDSVAIMDGADEGMFSWFTTNFLLDKFSHLEKTVAAFDLGGGSNQVTFSVTSDDIPKQSPHAKNIHHVSVFNRNISVFTESFLGMGLNAARKEILTHPDNGNDRVKTKGSADIELSSECVSSSVSGAKWNYAGKNYIVKGPKNNAVRAGEPGSVRFSNCLGIIQKIVDSAIPHDLPSLKEHDIYAFSYYFERMEENGLIDADTGGIVTVESIHKLASKVCENPKPDEPFMCLDLSFIYVLLHNGFGLDKSTNIFMRKNINGHQLNWALGAAFNLLQSDV